MFYCNPDCRGPKQETMEREKVTDYIRSIRDPEKPATLEDLHVVYEDGVMLITRVALPFRTNFESIIDLKAYLQDSGRTRFHTYVESYNNRTIIPTMFSSSADSNM
uniref:Uncharacterized protein n=1 Tax=Timema monikensis TaxID=170555 RepID=A0A7R9E2Z6_9NEOP|nr:unnamed protein product [Timema monikensis]